MTVVANSVHRHDQSIDLGIYDSDTALRPNWNEAALRHAGRTSDVVFVEEHSIRVLAVHLAKSWRNLIGPYIFPQRLTGDNYANDSKNASN